MLRLEQAQKEAVILACTMTNEAQATLFEIDVSSNFALTPVKDPMFPKTPIFLKTVSYCEDEAEAWRRQIKVSNTYPSLVSECKGCIDRETEIDK